VLPHGRRVAHELPQVHLAEVEPEVVGTGTGEVEQVRHQPLHASGLRLDRPAGLGGVGDTLADRLGETADAGQRRPQLVAHRQQEVPFTTLAGRERLGEHVQGVRQVGDLVRAVLDEPDGPVAGRQPVRSISSPDEGVRETPGQPEADQHRRAEPEREGQGQLAEHGTGHCAGLGHGLRDDDPTATVDGCTSTR